MHQEGWKCQMQQRDEKRWRKGLDERGQVDQGFIVDDQGREGHCTKSAKFIANFIVTLDDETTFLALDCMFF